MVKNKNGYKNKLNLTNFVLIFVILLLLTTVIIRCINSKSKHKNGFINKILILLKINKPLKIHIKKLKYL